MVLFTYASTILKWVAIRSRKAVADRLCTGKKACTCCALDQCVAAMWVSFLSASAHVMRVAGVAGTGLGLDFIQ